VMGATRAASRPCPFSAAQRRWPPARITRAH
jgi:hypothetical protein